VTLGPIDEQRWTDKQTAIVEEFLGVSHEPAESTAGARPS